MGTVQILKLIALAAELAQVINEEVQASDDAEVQAAWQQARGMFNAGFDAAYGAKNG